MNEENEPLMNLNPKSDFERFLWERNKTKAQAEHIEALTKSRTDLQNRVKELEAFIMEKHTKGHIFNLQNIITEKNKTITEQGKRFKKLKQEYDNLLAKHINIQQSIKNDTQ